MSVVDPRVMRVARACAREEMASGANAVLLTGSHVRGTAHAESDVDLIAVFRQQPGDGDRLPAMRRRSSQLVSIATTTVRATRAAFRDPGLVGTYVPGWRDAIVLEDPDGIAAALRGEAARWTWERVDGACDAWVAEQITGWAEEVHKLVAALQSPANTNAAVQRSILAIRLAPVMAVHRRLLCGTENVLWDRVGEAMGEEWVAAQSRALGMGGETLRESSLAALRLYVMAAGEVRRLLDGRQRAVVDHACALIMGETGDG